MSVLGEAIASENHQVQPDAETAMATAMVMEMVTEMAMGMEADHDTTTAVLGSGELSERTQARLSHDHEWPYYITEKTSLEAIMSSGPHVTTDHYRPSWTLSRAGPCRRTLQVNICIWDRIHTRTGKDIKWGDIGVGGYFG